MTPVTYHSIKTASYHPIYKKKKKKKKNLFYSRVTIKKSLTCNIKFYYKNMAWHNYHSVWISIPGSLIWKHGMHTVSCRCVKRIEIWDRVHVAKKRVSSGKKRVSSCKKRISSWQKRVSSCKKRVSSCQKRVLSCKKRVSSWQKRVSSC